MRKLSRGAWIAVAAATVAIPATVAIAKQGHGGWGSHRMSPETRARLDDGRLAMAKTALKLTAAQEPLWAAVEKEVRAGFEARTKRMEERRERWKSRRAARDKDDKAEAGDTSAKSGDRDMAKRYEKMSEYMTERADRMKAFSAAFTPFYASLTDEQKDVLKPLMRKLTPGGGHGRGWRHGGRWGGHGWGGHGGGKHHGGWREGRRGDRDGARMERSETPDSPGDDAADETPDSEN